MITKRIHTVLDQGTTLDDLEAFIAASRDEFGDGHVQVGVSGSNEGVIMYSQVVNDD